MSMLFEFFCSPIGGHLRIRTVKSGDHYSWCYFLPTAYEVRGKAMFPQASVILSMGGASIPQCNGAGNEYGGRWIWRGWIWGCIHLHPSPAPEVCTRRQTINERATCILLECILVQWMRIHAPFAVVLGMHWDFSLLLVYFDLHINQIERYKQFNRNWTNPDDSSTRDTTW